MQSQSNVQSQTSLTVTLTLGKRPCNDGTKSAVDAPDTPSVALAGRVPRISRLMALAIHFDDLLRRGEVKDYAELARLGHVSRARVTQIMNLLNLAPDIQEALLFLPPVEQGRDPIKEWRVRPVSAKFTWKQQRKIFVDRFGEVLKRRT